MSGDVGYVCSGCGERHDELPMHYGSGAPAYWSDAVAEHPESELTSDQCVIEGAHFFVKGLVEIPVVGGGVFSWAVWVSLSPQNFVRMGELWETPGREQAEPYFGWLASELYLYERPTLNLKTNVHTRPVGERPFVQLEPTDHPLAVEQRSGITRERVQWFAEQILHAEGGR
ncbi:DUF2199 domain-containing protein [Actinomadura sp. NAK00032]|uniref:DUF2199 domain-containing protein n=1 Tax=Actinomadura sp. NAK00032 TaxID=2742128 RepID=UPI001591FA1A|nr:DUF2199 domain-containing protein [Actinomadura sp. NAK00032]QKW39371.1 DUF2199 domain-containing protein [Actinomadura sp. NAK00032]